MIRPRPGPQQPPSPQPQPRRVPESSPRIFTHPLRRIPQSRQYLRRRATLGLSKLLRGGSRLDMIGGSRLDMVGGSRLDMGRHLDTKRLLVIRCGQRSSSGEQGMGQRGFELQGGASHHASLRPSLREGGGLPPPPAFVCFLIRSHPPRPPAPTLCLSCPRAGSQNGYRTLGMSGFCLYRPESLTLLATLTASKWYTVTNQPARTPPSHMVIETHGTNGTKREQLKNAVALLWYHSWLELASWSRSRLEPVSAGTLPPISGGEHPPNSTALGKALCGACRRRHGRDAKGQKQHL